MIGKIKYKIRKISGFRKGYFMVIGILCLLLLIGGFSYALFTSQIESRGSLNIVTGNLYSLIESESLNKENQIVIESGESKTVVLTLKNVNSIKAKFNLWYEGAEGVSVSYDSNKDTPPGKAGEVFEKDTMKTYQLKIANQTTTSQTITFGSETGLSNKELIFPQNKKVIESVIPRVKMDEGAMIKVVYDESSKNWVKAGNDNWYDYDEGRWANAVTVSSASRSSYQSADVGSAISMDDIETMWVWIPRYSYTIGSEDGTNYYGKQGTYLSSAPTRALPGEIDVKFISKSEKDEGNAQYKVADGVSGWRTPDAFTFGDEELSGIWVGKFETSSSNPSTEYGGGNTTELDAMIKPNVTSWRHIQVANIASVGRKLSTSGNRYGFSNKIDSHAMKNDEWASVSYLSQSKYGKLGNRDYSGANKEVYQNRSNEYLTGCSYGIPSRGFVDFGCLYQYNEANQGTGSSTTGTIYGVYDMSGGAWEEVMGNYNRYSGYTSKSYTVEEAKNIFGIIDDKAIECINSGYTGICGFDNQMFTGKDWLEDKYYNFYTSNDALTACNGNPCLSHGLHDLIGWYEDFTRMPELIWPWFVRGGGFDDDTNAGVFYYSHSNGNIYENHSFRLVLSEN